MQDDMSFYNGIGGIVFGSTLCIIGIRMIAKGGKQIERDYNDKK